MPKMKWVAKDIPSKARVIGGARTTWTFEGVRGLSLECLANGDRLWKCRYQVFVLGKRVERKFHLGRLDPEAQRVLVDTEQSEVLTPGQARDKAAQVLARVASGSDPWRENKATKLPLHARETFHELYEAWLERHAKVKAKSWKAYEGLYHRHVRELLGAEMVRSIDRPIVIATLDKIAKKASGLQANKCQTLISSIFSWALDEGKIAQHPALRIRKRGEDVKRDRVMTPDEMRGYWKAVSQLPQPEAAVLQLLTLLGSRLGEVTDTQQQELLLDDLAPSWTQPGKRVKNGVTHMVPLPPLAASIFKSAVDAAKGDYIFRAHRGGDKPVSRTQVSRTFAKIVKTLAIQDIRLHDLRHCCATGMASCGVPTDVRQRVMNQISGQGIGARYDQHDYFAEKRRALEIWEKRLLEIVDGQPASGLRW